MGSLLFRMSSFSSAAIAIAATLAAGAASADSLHLSAASSATNQIYEVPVPSGPAATLQNLQPVPPKPTDIIKSLVYVSNEQTSKIDLLAADTTGGRIVRYPAATTATTTVAFQVLWAWPVAGPRATDGLSVDGNGNLFVVSSDPARAELWVMRRDPSLKVGGGFLPPVRMDNRYGSSNTLRLLDTLVVRTATPGGGLGAGDLLVLANDGRVLRYSAKSIQDFLAGAAATPAGSTPPPIALPQTLIDKTMFPGGSVGVHVPTGFDLWPTVDSVLDGNLMISTAGGWILNFKINPGPVAVRQANLATGLGSSLTKIKTFVKLTGSPSSQSNVAYVLVARSSPSQVFELQAAACGDSNAVCNGPVAGTITTNVAAPVGLAVTDSSSTPTANCATTPTQAAGAGDPGCTLLGGAIKHGINTSDTLSSTLLDQQCIVDPDPRWNGNTCSATDLPVETVCPGFGPSVIPKYVCGGGGALGKGFALIKTTETQSGGVPNPSGDTLITAELSANAVLGSSVTDFPDITALWAPLSDTEGTIPERPYMMEDGAFKGSGRIITPGKSLIGVGFMPNPAGLPGGSLEGLANFKLTNLKTVVDGTTNFNNPTDKTALQACIATTTNYLAPSSNVSDTTRYACAAHQAWVCDSTITTSTFTTNPNSFSAYSAIRGRLANIIMTIDNRLAGHPVSTVWPLPEPSAPSVSCLDDMPPTPAPILQAGTITGNSVVLNWSASTDSGSGIAGYAIYNGATKIDTAGPTATSYTVQNLAPATAYSFYVVAFDNATPANKTSSNTVGVPTLDTVGPTAPVLQQPQAADITANSVALNWSVSQDQPLNNPLASGMAGYDVYKGNAKVARVTGTSYTVTQLATSTTYNFHVDAVDNGGYTTSSNTVSATTIDNVAPAAPTGLTKAWTATRTVKLTWTAPTTNSDGSALTDLAGYTVYFNGSQFTTTATTYSITIPSSVTSSNTKFSVQVGAYDTAVPANPSAKSTAILVSCYDPNNDHDCDSYP